NPPDHTDRPGRQRGGSGCAGESGRALLPTHPRLSGAVLAGLADPQAEGDAPGPGRTHAGGSGGGVERPSGKPATAVAAAMAANLLADGEEELDAAAAEDDETSDPLPCGAGARGGGLAGPYRLGWLRGLRDAAS